MIHWMKLVVLCWFLIILAVNVENLQKQWIQTFVKCPFGSLKMFVVSRSWIIKKNMAGLSNYRIHYTSCFLKMHAVYVPALLCTPQITLNPSSGIPVPETQMQLGKCDSPCQEAQHLFYGAEEKSRLFG